MQTFLASLQHNEQKLSLVKNSKELQIIDNESIYLLFNGTLTNSINSIELLYKSYQKEGISCLKELEGTFSLFIFDKETKELFIAKDKIGTQPLYFTQTNESFIFGTHLRDFSQLIDLQVDPSSLANYLQFGFVLQPNSIFKDCYKVQSGEYISFNLQQTNYTRHTYWKLESCYDEKKHTSGEKEIINTAHELLQKSVEQNSKNTNSGFSLSGGYDSSTLVAIAQKQSDKKMAIKASDKSAKKPNQINF